MMRCALFVVRWLFEMCCLPLVVVTVGVADGVVGFWLLLVCLLTLCFLRVVGSVLFAVVDDDVVV